MKLNGFGSRAAACQGLGRAIAERSMQADQRRLGPLGTCAAGKPSSPAPISTHCGASSPKIVGLSGKAGPTFIRFASFPETKGNSID